MFSLTQSGSAKVEAQHGKTEAVQRLHGVKDNLVVQSSAEERMGMTHNCSVCRIFCSGVEDRFQASSRAFEEEATESWRSGSRIPDYRNFGDSWVRLVISDQ